MTVPPEVRRLWSSQKAHAQQYAADHPDVDFNDIIEIEGIGPLLILHNWPWLVRKMPG